MKVAILVGLVFLGLIFGGSTTPGEKKPEMDRNLVEIVRHHAEQQVVQSQQMASLQEQWNTERDHLNHERDLLERERQEIATHRQRDPVIAESILQVGTIVLGLLPIGLCILLLTRSVEPSDDTLIASTLVSELASPNPSIFRADHACFKGPLLTSQANEHGSPEGSRLLKGDE